MRKYGSQILIRCYPLCEKSIFRVLFSASCLAVKCPGHGSVGRRCSCEAPVRTGLCVIRHAVEDPIDLHSNCVPVGPFEPRLSLHRSATGSHPRAGLREPEGGPVSGFAVAGCPLSPPPLNTAASIHTDMFIHIRRQKERERAPPVCFGAFDSEGISNKEGFTKNIFFFSFFF